VSLAITIASVVGHHSVDQHPGVALRQSGCAGVRCRDCALHFSITYQPDMATESRCGRAEIGAAAVV